MAATLTIDDATCAPWARIDVATRGRSAHPSLLRMRVGAAGSSGFNFCCRSLDEQRGRLSEALLYSILLPRRRHYGCFPQSVRGRVLDTQLGRSPTADLG